MHTKDVMSFHSFNKFRLMHFIGVIIASFKVSPFNVPGPNLNIILEVSHVIQMIDKY